PGSGRWPGQTPRPRRPSPGGKRARPSLLLEGSASRRQAASLAAMRQALHQIVVDTPGEGLVEITRPVSAWVSTQGMDEGLLTLFCRHTSASLLIQENADPDVRADLQDFFARLAPHASGRY